MSEIQNHVISVIIAGDRVLVREGIKRLLQDEPDLQVVGQAASCEETVRLTSTLKPRILLLDTALPDLDGVEVLRRLARQKVNTRTILLTAAMEESQVVEAINLGASGLLLKTAGREMLVKSIRCVVKGEHWLDRRTMTEVLRHQQGERSTAQRLTARELELVSEVAVGSSNLGIAARLGISEKTVKRHLANIFEKLGVASRLELAVLAIRKGLGRTTKKVRS